MDKGVNKHDDCEMTTIHASENQLNSKKPNVEYFGELGTLGEFEGGLMEADEFKTDEKTIITSKEDVLKHIIAKKNKMSIQRAMLETPQLEINV